MNFEVRTVYTRDTAAAITALGRRQRNRRAWVMQVLLLALAGVFVVLGNLNQILVWSKPGWKEAGMALLLAVVLISAFRKERKQEQQQVDALWARWPDKGAALDFRFTEAGFSYRTPVSECRYEYSVLRELAEDGGYFYLFITGEMAYVLKKTDFTRGAPEEFRKFLEERTGKTVQFMG